VQDELAVGQVGDLGRGDLELVLLLIVLLDGRERDLWVEVARPRHLATVAQHEAVDVGQARGDRLTGTCGKQGGVTIQSYHQSGQCSIFHISDANASANIIVNINKTMKY